MTTTTPAARRRAAPGAVPRLIRARPLLSFFVLANLASWLAWTPYVLSQNGLGVLSLRYPGGAMGSQLLGVLPGAYLGPIGAALLITTLTGGRAGLRAWAKRLWRWRVGWRWYLAIPLLVPTAIVLGSIAIGGTPQVPPVALLVAYVPGLLIQMVTTGLAEEPGWRDFALPRLQQRFGPLGSVFVLGPLWAAWHYPLFLTEWGGWPEFSWQRPISFTVFCVLFNVVMTWVFNRTGQSLPMSMLLHVSVNNFASILYSDMFPGLDTEQFQQALVLASGVVAGVLLWRTRGRLGYDPRTSEGAAGAS